MSAVQQLVILGATGSIGLSTLDVVARNQQQFKVFALTAGQNAKKMAELCIAHQPRYAVMASELAAKQLSALLKYESKTQVMHGEKAMSELCAHGDVDTVMSAIVGAAGLLPTLSAVEAGKKVLLANKESLVMSGQLFIDKVKKHQATLLPIDSEHNAIFQCLPSALQNTQGQARLGQHGVSKILLTGSGGPFLNRDINTLNTVSVSEAVAHPNWSMGQKISVDSATMMNKGLEVIEAHWLFGLQSQQIEVVLHRQSVIHSMVDYEDGSVLAQMGNPDMRTPITNTLSWPERIASGVAPLDLVKVGRLDFSEADFSRFPCLRLAYKALNDGGTATAILNAANEVAVQAFLDELIRFTEIAKIIEDVLTELPIHEASSLEQILADDAAARDLAMSKIGLCTH